MLIYGRRTLFVLQSFFIQPNLPYKQYLIPPFLLPLPFPPLSLPLIVVSNSIGSPRSRVYPPVPPQGKYPVGFLRIQRFSIYRSYNMSSIRIASTIVLSKVVVEAPERINSSLTFSFRPLRYITFNASLSYLVSGIYSLKREVQSDVEPF